MSHQMNFKNCCHGQYSYRGFGKNLFNKMMNKFRNSWFIAVIGEEYALFGKKVVTFILVQQSKFPYYCKKNNKKYI